MKFKAGIDDRDLQTKVDDARQYLEKGYSCQITVMSRFKRAIQNNQIVEETYNRVYHLLEDYVKGNPQLTGKRQNWRHKSVTIRPIDKT